MAHRPRAHTYLSYDALADHLTRSLVGIDSSQVHYTVSPHQPLNFPSAHTNSINTLLYQHAARATLVMLKYKCIPPVRNSDHLISVSATPCVSSSALPIFNTTSPTPHTPHTATTDMLTNYDYIYETILHILQSIIIHSELRLVEDLITSHTLKTPPKFNINKNVLKPEKTQKPENAAHFDLMISKNIIYSEALVSVLLDVLPSKYIRFIGKGNTNTNEYRIYCIESSIFMSQLSYIINSYNNNPTQHYILKQKYYSEKGQNYDQTSSTSYPTGTLPSKLQSLNTVETNRINRSLSNTFDDRYNKAHSLFETAIHKVATVGSLTTSLTTSITTPYTDTNTTTAGTGTGINKGKGTTNTNKISEKDEVMIVDLLLLATPYVKSLFYRRNSEIDPSTTGNGSGSGNTANPHPPLSGTAFTPSIDPPTAITDGGSNVDASSGADKPITLLDSPAEYLTWLLEEGSLSSIARTPDSSFQATQLYYRYRDPWEVHVADPAWLDKGVDYIRYGRERYTGMSRLATTSSGDGSGGGSIGGYSTLLLDLLDKSASSTAKMITRNRGTYIHSTYTYYTLFHCLHAYIYMIGTSTASLTDPLVYSDDERRALYTQQLLRLWEALKADHWLISTISEAHVTEPTSTTDISNDTNNDAYTSGSSLIVPTWPHTTSAPITTTPHPSDTNDNNRAPIKPKAVSPWQQFKNTLIATRTPSRSPPPINSQSSTNQQPSFSMPRWNRVSSISEDGVYHYYYARLY